MTDGHPAPGRHLVAPGVLWFGLFGAAAAWSVQELVSFAVVSHACYPDWQPRAAPVLPGAWTIALAVSVLMLLLGLVGATSAWFGWRRSAPDEADSIHRQLEVGERRVHFMATSGLIVSGLILFTIVLNLIGLFILPPCG